VVLAVTYALGLIIGRTDASARRRKRGAYGAGALVVLAVLNLLVLPGPPQRRT
jgi:hypothetical protein